MKYVFLFSVTLVLSACKPHDPDLEKSIFRPDPAYPELPQYSEWGYNTFGAFYDRQAFVFINNEIPIRVLQDTVTSFVFSGRKGNSYSYYYGGPKFSVTFKFGGLNPLTFEDLVSLDQVTMDLTSSDSKVEVNDITVQTVKVLAGTFRVNRAQRLFVDDKLEEVILSGEFEFQGLIDNVPVSVSNGRFDVGINSGNFFRY